MYGDRGEITFIRSDYGIYYPKTEIIDLRGNVVISDTSGTKLNTSQLYWDAGKEWLFTEKNFTFTNSSYDIKAVRLDANRSFQKLMTGMIRGNILVKDENINLMNKFHRFSENMYLFFGFIFMIETVVNVQNMNQRFYISCILGAAAFGIFFFRRKYRKKFESRNQNQK